MTEDSTETPQRRRNWKPGFLAAGFALLGGIVSLICFGTLNSRAATPVAAASQADSLAPAIDEAPSHMARPDQYRMYIAYFEKHQVGDAMNQDVLAAIKLAADDVKKTGMSLVVTCHSNDAIAGNPKATEKDFKLARFVTIRDDLIAQGLDARRIKYEWNDAALTAAAAKEGTKSTMEKPNCYMETAVPTSMD